MPLREFEDAQGRLWQVCDVQATAVERRSGRDRRTQPRATPERRQQRQVRVTVLPRYRSGWLVFASLRGRRRLAPIPSGWHTYTEDELRRLLDEAELLRPTG